MIDKCLDDRQILRCRFLQKINISLIKSWKKYVLTILYQSNAILIICLKLNMSYGLSLITWIWRTKILHISLNFLYKFPGNCLMKIVWLHSRWWNFWVPSLAWFVIIVLYRSVTTRTLGEKTNQTNNKRRFCQLWFTVVWSLYYFPVNFFQTIASFSTSFL